MNKKNTETIISRLLGELKQHEDDRRVMLLELEAFSAYKDTIDRICEAFGYKRCGVLTAEQSDTLLRWATSYVIMAKRWKDSREDRDQHDINSEILQRVNEVAGWATPETQGDLVERVKGLVWTEAQYLGKSMTPEASPEPAGRQPGEEG